ncbi:hypothetical protein Q8A73_013651 [Channa argus]|nr:hypothetical protein Q8A73_013651 [Channa argus]
MEEVFYNLDTCLNPRDVSFRSTSDVELKDSVVATFRLQQEQSFTWMAVLVPLPDQRESPRLFFRKVHGPAVSGSSSPGTTPGSPHTPPGSLPNIPSPPSSSSHCSRFPGFSSLPFSPSCSPNVSSNPCPRARCPPSQPPSGPEDEHWTCELLETKMIFRKLPRARSPEVREVSAPHAPAVPQRPPNPLLTAGSKQTWVRDIHDIIKERNRQRSIRGGKRAAGPPSGQPLSKHSFRN